ncbi:MAG UNVERIFIED_CONTAM: hypothetical protein LVR18_19930 [Planctomycetaceae bacterium]|jgi:hypothetical protein
MYETIVLEPLIDQNHEKQSTPLPAHRNTALNELKSRSSSYLRDNEDAFLLHIREILRCLTAVFGSSCRLRAPSEQYDREKGRTKKSSHITLSCLIHPAPLPKEPTAMANFADLVKQINVASRGGSPASLVCVFVATILVSTATLCLQHSDPTVQQCAMALYFAVAAFSVFGIFNVLWYKPDVFRWDNVRASVAEIQYGNSADQ